MHTPKEVFEKLIAPLHFQLSQSGTFYRFYLEEKTFKNAELLRDSNKKVVQLVMQNKDLVPAEIKEDVLQLINHYEHWFTQFKLHMKKVRPGPADRFVFNPASGHYAFPSDSEQRINLYYTELKNQLTSELLVRE